jgi:hypothetical protein
VQFLPQITDGHAFNLRNIKPWEEVTVFSAFYLQYNTVKASSGSSAGLSLYVDLEQITFSLNLTFITIAYYLTNPVVEICIR